MRDTVKTAAARDSRVMTEDGLVLGQFMDPSIIYDTIGNLSLRAFNWCNKNMVVPESIYNNNY